MLLCLLVLVRNENGFFFGIIFFIHMTKYMQEPVHALVESMLFFKKKYNTKYSDQLSFFFFLIIDSPKLKAQQSYPSLSLNSKWPSKKNHNSRLRRLSKGKQGFCLLVLVWQRRGSFFFFLKWFGVDTDEWMLLLCFFIFFYFGLLSIDLFAFLWFSLVVNKVLVIWTWSGEGIEVVVTMFVVM